MDGAGYTSDALDLTAYGVCLQCTRMLGIGDLMAPLIAGGVVLFGRPLVTWGLAYLGAARARARRPTHVDAPDGAGGGADGQ